MKNILLIPILILLFMYSNLIVAQSDKNLNQFNLSGKVKSIEETRFFPEEDYGEITENMKWEGKRISFNEKGNLIESLKYSYNDGEINDLLTRVYKYDKMDCLIEESLIYGDSKSIWIYKRDDRGRLIETSGPFNDSLKFNSKRAFKRVYAYGDQNKLKSIELFRLSKDGKLRLDTVIEYDENGEKKRTIRHILDGSTATREEEPLFFEREERGNIVEVNARFVSNGKISFKTISKFNNDKKKRLIKKERFERSGIKDREEIYYRKSGKLHKEKTYSYAGKLKTTNIYDKYGNIIEAEHNNGDTGKFKFRYISKYVYDEKGNWVKKTQKRKDNFEWRLFHSSNPLRSYKNVELVKRKIEYFD